MKVYHIRFKDGTLYNPTFMDGYHVFRTREFAEAILHSMRLMHMRDEPVLVEYEVTEIGVVG